MSAKEHFEQMNLLVSALMEAAATDLANQLPLDNTESALRILKAALAARAENGGFELYRRGIKRDAAKTLQDGNLPDRQLELVRSLSDDFSQATDLLASFNPEVQAAAYSAIRAAYGIGLATESSNAQKKLKRIADERAAVARAGRSEPEIEDILIEAGNSFLARSDRPKTSHLVNAVLRDKALLIRIKGAARTKAWKSDTDERARIERRVRDLMRRGKIRLRND